MSAVTFYDTPPDGRWPRVARLAEAAYMKKRRAIILCADRSEATKIDEYLWSFRDDAFVPHELVADTEAEDATTPLVIVTSETQPIDADILIQLTPASLDFAARFVHVIDIVDHRTPELLQASRDRYKAWRTRGVTPVFQKS